MPTRLRRVNELVKSYGFKLAKQYGNDILYYRGDRPTACLNILVIQELLKRVEAFDVYLHDGKLCLYLRLKDTKKGVRK